MTLGIKRLDIDKQLSGVPIHIRKNMYATQNGFWLVAPLLLAVMLGLPLFVVIKHLGALLESDVQHLANTVLLGYIGNTFLLVTVVTLFSLVIGVTTAWLIIFFNFFGRKVLSFLLVLPLALPAYIAAISYDGIFNFAGPLQIFARSVLGLQIGNYPTLDFQSFAGLCFVLIFTSYPYVYLTSRAFFSGETYAAIEIARSNGYSTLQTFWRVLLPMSRPGIVAGMALVIMETLGEYGASHYYGIDTLTVGIFRVWFALGNVTAALGIAAVLLIFVASITILERWQRRRLVYDSVSMAHRPITRVSLSKRFTVLTFSICIIPMIFGFLFPVMQLVWWALLSWGKTVNWDILPYLGNTMALTLVTSLIILLLAILISYSVRLRDDRLISFLSKCASSGYAIPAAVLAIGIATTYSWIDHQIIYVWRRFFDVSPGLLLSGTVFALFAGYVVRFFAIGFNNIDSGFSSISKQFDEVGRSMGMKPSQTLIRVSWKRLRPMVFAAGVLLSVEIVKELPLTMILRPFNTETLATQVFRLASNEMMAAAAIPALLIVTLGTIAMFLLKPKSSGPSNKKQSRKVDNEC